jgi:signal transduction histidine kinase
MIDKATKLLEQASGDVRRISHNMMPGLLTKYGFFEAVEDLFEQIDESEKFHAVVEIRGECKRLSENTEIMLYRIVQEMVNNTLKYAEAKNIILEIDVTTDKLKFSYFDDGKGFEVEEKLSSKSIGLTSIQSRVKFLGGELETESSTGAGVRYTFEIAC